MDKPRQSNIELMRIVAMFFIVMHHYVVKSGVANLFDYSDPSANMVFLRIVGAWGKTAINAFVLITGYFMCESQLTSKRFFKVYLEWMFYACALYLIFGIAGYEPVSVRRVGEVALEPFTGVGKGFTPSFLWFYLCIPFFNALIKELDRRRLMLLIGVLCALFVMPTTFFRNGQVFHYVYWYMTIYYIGAFIRIYPWHWMENKRLCLSLLLGAVSVTAVTLYGRLICSALPMKIIANVFNPTESCMLMPLVIGILVFLVFKNSDIGYHSWINPKFGF